MASRSSRPSGPRRGEIPIRAPDSRTSEPFAGLGPEVVLDAAASAGLDVDGRLMALNSYENRVYQLGVEGGAVVLKFYRPGRWSDDQIREEHGFTAELAERELPVAMPIEVGGETLLRFEGYRFAAFPWLPGRAPDLDHPQSRQMLGRALARVHQVGALRPFVHRPRLSLDGYGGRARQAVLASELLPQALRQRYAEVSAGLLDTMGEVFDAAGPVGTVRLHGDCHLGNLLWNERGPLFVDLDDCMSGPRVQDLWMLLSGSPGEQQAQWAQLLEGYQQFADFDFREVLLIEALRALRMLHHAGWVASRWSDPAFPRAFPWFAEARHWEQHVLDLMEQSSNMREPPLLQ